MNPNNYASLEASKRLAGAGIVLETDFVWYMCLSGEWDILPRTPSLANMTPAPCMAEVWRELPWFIDFRQDEAEFLGVYKHGDETGCGYGDLTAMSTNTNPTDALIDLLIWVRKEKT